MPWSTRRRRPRHRPAAAGRACRAAGPAGRASTGPRSPPPSTSRPRSRRRPASSTAPARKPRRSAPRCASRAVRPPERELLLEPCMPLIEANGTSLFYDETGPADAPVGRVLKLAGHDARNVGCAGSRPCGAVARLSATTRAVMAVRRQRAEASPSRRCADDLAGLLAALDIERAHVVGLSLGGMIGPGLAIRHPRRVESLVLMATAPMLAPTRELGGAGGHRAGERHGRDRRCRAGALVHAGNRARDPTPPAAGFASAASRLIDANGYAACCLAIRDADLRAGLASIRVPTLVVAGCGRSGDDGGNGRKTLRAPSRVRASKWCRTRPISSRWSGPSDTNALLAAFLDARADAAVAAAFRPSSRAREPQGQCWASTTCSARWPARAVRHAVAGLHHPRRLGRDVGRLRRCPGRRAPA